MPDYTTDQQAALEKRNVIRRMFVFCDALDENGDPAGVGMWNGDANVTVDGDVFYGVGVLLDVSGISAVADLSVVPCAVSLSGVDPTANLLVRGYTIAQRPITVWRGIFDVDANALIGDLVPLFQGYVDDITISTNPGEPGKPEPTTITLACESIGRELTIKSTDTRSHQSQIKRKAGDLFFKYTDAVSGWTPYFGGRVPNAKRGDRHGRGKWPFSR